MRFALGCAFTLEHLAMNLKCKKLKTPLSERIKIFHDHHKREMALKIFKEHYKIVIKDIIDNNVTYWLPVYGKRLANMHMLRFQGKAFLNLRRGGKWAGLDIVKSMFTGYLIGLYLLGDRTPRVKNVYVSKELLGVITENTNNGMNYGDSKYDKKLSDYYPQMFAMYPTILESDIKRILNFMWKSLYLHNSYGGDVIVTDLTFWSYIGRLRHDPIQHFDYYVRKLSTKLRVLHKRKKIPWDGYYYFAMYNYDEYLKLKNSKGRPRNKFILHNVYMYKIFEECNVKNSSCRHIFRIPYLIDVGYTHFVRELKARDIEMIIEREPLKFKDILVTEYNYEFI